MLATGSSRRTSFFLKPSPSLTRENPDTSRKYHPTFLLEKFSNTRAAESTRSALIVHEQDRPIQLVRYHLGGCLSFNTWGPYGNSEEPGTLFSCKLSR